MCRNFKVILQILQHAENMLKTSRKMLGVRVERVELVRVELDKVTQLGSIRTTIRTDSELDQA